MLAKVGSWPKFEFIKTQKPCLEASYEVAYGVAKEKKAHMSGETLIKPYAMKISELVLAQNKERNLRPFLCQMAPQASKLLTFSGTSNGGT